MWSINKMATLIHLSFVMSKDYAFHPWRVLNVFCVYFFKYLSHINSILCPLQTSTLSNQVGGCLPPCTHLTHFSFPTPLSTKSAIVFLPRVGLWCHLCLLSSSLLNNPSVILADSFLDLYFSFYPC